MFLEERYEKIIYCLKENGRVKVKDLSEKFNVTEDCIRKDLRFLESKGALKRVYGGAILKREHTDIKPIDIRKNLNTDKKSQIAKNAISLINCDEIIFLDTSTTNLELSKILATSDLRLTVITNMLEIALELKDSTTIRVICIGGEFNKDVGAIIGSSANDYISQFTFDKAFIGACGINKESGAISTVNLEDGNTKRTIIKYSHKNYLSIETEKFNYDEFFKFASIDEFDGLVTEDEIIYGI